MRLLKCIKGPGEEDVEVKPTEFIASQIPLYAILSHRWRDEEVEYHHITADGAYRTMKGYSKIESCAHAALRMGLEYIWVDTCCIRKESSAELSEAINSMYQWYKDSEACFAFLDDVSKDDEQEIHDQIKGSTWFTRGWTLQELIAPRRLIFFSKEWKELGSSQHDLSDVVSSTTRISSKILRGRKHLNDVGVAEKMSWAADRSTTRVEDIAYSLLGLFGVNMPPIYGEGIRAFRRLQLEIIQTTNDHTIFAWQDTTCDGDMLATSPSQFKGCHIYQPIDYTQYIRQFGISNPKPDFTMTNAGLHIQLPMMHLNRLDRSKRGMTTRQGFAVLACVSTANREMAFVRIFLDQWFVSGYGIQAYRRIARNGQTTHTSFNFLGSVGTQTIWIGPSSERARTQNLYRLAVGRSSSQALLGPISNTLDKVMDEIIIKRRGEVTNQN